MKSKIIFFEKGHVNGACTRETFSFLKSNLQDENEATEIQWNFTKFLFDHKRKAFKRHGLKTSPIDMEKDIIQLLNKKEAEI